MAKSLLEYAEWLAERELIWPQPPPIEPVKATAYTKPLDGICAVVWDLYGTLVRIADGELLLDHPQQIRMQIALEKTIKEFNMWNSMSRKPGAPWEYMYQQYTRLLKDREMAGTGRKGDLPDISATAIWRKLIDRLAQNEYTYDEAFYGDLDELAEKVALFFQSNLQGYEAAPAALETTTQIADSSRMQAALADAQSFTLVQTLRAFSAQGTLPALGKLFEPSVSVLSYQEEIRKPSPSLYERSVERFAEHGIEPAEVLYIGSRLREDLVHAKQLGFRTALYAGDKLSLRVHPPDLKDAERKPDRLVTELTQIPEILNL